MSTRYKIRQKLISIGDDFWIENQKVPELNSGTFYLAFSNLWHMLIFVFFDEKSEYFHQ